MARGSDLRAQDLRAVRNLMDECRELGDDPFVWRTHFCDKLAGLVSADLVFCVETDGCRGPQPRDLGFVDWGWHQGFNRDGWLRAVQEFQQNPFYSLGLRTYLARMVDQDGVALSRRDLVADPDWDSSIDFQCVHRVIGVDHIMWCFRSLSVVREQEAGVFATREIGRRDFSARDKKLLAEMQRLAASEIGRSLARFSEPAPTELPARVRSVLRCLLDGDSDKQIAARLKISRYTVNAYTKQVFKHFGVEGRTELLARWIRRGWRAGDWVDSGSDQSVRSPPRPDG